MKRFIIGLLFVYSSLFALDTVTNTLAECVIAQQAVKNPPPIGLNYSYTSNKVDYMYQSDVDAIPPVTCLNTQAVQNNLTLTWMGSYYKVENAQMYFTWNTTGCVPPLVLDEEMVCRLPPPLVCDAGYVDVNGSCEIETCTTAFQIVATPAITVCNELGQGHIWSCNDSTGHAVFDSTCDTTDSDGDGIYDYSDQFPYDFDNDGISTPYDTNDTLANTENFPIFDDRVCDSVKQFGVNGYHLVSISQEEPCTVEYLNERLLGGGDSYYKATYALCLPDCWAYFGKCVPPKIYSYSDGGCIDPNKKNPETTCIELPPELTRDGGKCYDTFKCDDGTFSRKVEAVCPDLDGDGLPDNNITQASVQEGTLGALSQYGASTSAKQDELINLQDLTNQSVKKSNTLLSDISSKIEASSNKNHTDLEKIDTSISALNTALSGLSVVADMTTTDTILNNALFSNDPLPSDDAVTDFDSLVSSTGLDLDNMKTTLDGSGSEVQGLYDSLQTGFVVNGVKTQVVTCPLAQQFQLTSSQSIDFDLDICNAVYPFYDMGYTVSYWSALTSSIIFLLSILLGGL